MKLLRFVPFILLLGFLFFVSTMPKPVTLGLSTSFLHPAAFFVLSLFLLWIFQSYNARGSYILTLLVILMIALIDEYIQSFTPGRTSSFIDVGLDMLGAFCILVFWFLQKTLSVLFGKS